MLAFIVTKATARTGRYHTQEGEVCPRDTSHTHAWRDSSIYGGGTPSPFVRPQDGLRLGGGGNEEK